MHQNLQQSADKEYLVYNTACAPLKMPEYGRLVLQMVDFALSLENRDERKAYAQKIIHVMAGFNPQMKNVPDYQHKLWDHLAYLADYKLDIDYPVEIHRYGENVHPNRLSYPGNKIRLRHYGHYVEMLLAKLKEKANLPERDALIMEVADRIRRNLVEWKGDTPDDARIAHDIERYTDYAVSAQHVMDCLSRQQIRTKRGRRY